MKRAQWQCGMLVPERYARKTAGEAFEQQAQFLLEDGREAELEIVLEFTQEKTRHRVPFSIDLSEVSEATWPIVFAGTPIFGNFSIWVQPAATASVLDKVTLKLSNRSLLKSAQHEEMLRAAFVDVRFTMTCSGGAFIETVSDQQIEA
ncbi:MAG: hypothetical protein ACRENA_05790 [Vulcanimicrobiaceae bacterium]